MVKNSVKIEVNHIDKDIKYFEDMKSVGEEDINNSFNIVSESEEYQYNKILFRQDRFDYYLKKEIKSGIIIANKTNKTVVLLHYNKEQIPG